MKGRLERRNKKQGFTIIQNEILQRTDLSWKAKGILAYLISLPQDWRLYITEVINHSTDGISSTRTGFKELVNKGYIKKEVHRNGRGQFDDVVWIFDDEPFALDNPEKKVSATKKPPKCENPNSDNPALQITHSTKETVLINNILVHQGDFLEIMTKDLEALRFLFKKFNLKTYQLQEALLTYLSWAAGEPYGDKPKYKTLAQWYYDLSAWVKKQTKRSLANYIHKSTYQTVRAERQYVTALLESNLRPGLFRKLSDSEPTLHKYLQKKSMENTKIKKGA